jgi:hypothetical protein
VIAGLLATVGATSTISADCEYRHTIIDPTDTL